MSDERATAAVDKDKHHMYLELTDDVGSVFYKRSMTDVFIVAASLGYYRKRSVPIPSGKKKDLFVTTTLGTGSDEKIWLMKSIAISNKGVSALKSMKDVVTICQEYANFGIDILYELHKTSDNEARDLAKMMSEALDAYIE